MEVAREGLLVRVDDGWGNRPPPGFSRESLAEAQAEAIACLERLAAGQEIAPQLPSVQFGLDCARRCWPAQTTPLPEPYPLIQGSPGAAQTLEELAAQDPSKAKLKVARYPMRDELALIRLLCDRIPTLKLVLDASQGWTREEAWAFCGHLDPNRIEYLEDPCADFADIAFVANRTGMPVAIDELLAQGKPWGPFPSCAPWCSSPPCSAPDPLRGAGRPRSRAAPQGDRLLLLRIRPRPEPAVPSGGRMGAGSGPRPGYQTLAGGRSAGCGRQTRPEPAGAPVSP